MTAANVETATLTRQSYGIASAQVSFGRPSGIWLECTRCDESQVIVGSNSNEWAAIPTPQAALVFIRHGWTGEGDNLMKARCPKCSASEVQS